MWQKYYSRDFINYIILIRIEGKRKKCRQGSSLILASVAINLRDVQLDRCKCKWPAAISAEGILFLSAFALPKLNFNIFDLFMGRSQIPQLKREQTISFVLMLNSVMTAVHTRKQPAIRFTQRVQSNVNPQLGFYSLVRYESQRPPDSQKWAKCFNI